MSEWPDPSLPPGQRHAVGWPVLHYGPVPKKRDQGWDLTVSGATADGEQHGVPLDELCALQNVDVSADLHCVTRWSVTERRWTGVPAGTLVERFPPAPHVEHVLAWAEYGYSANLRLSDLTAAGAVLATHCDGEPLTPEHGWPVRLIVPHLYAWKGPKWLRGIEYLSGVERGFWEQRGYHIDADPWREQRYSYQE